MPGVKNVKTTVGHDYAFSGGAGLLNPLVQAVFAVHRVFTVFILKGVSQLVKADGGGTEFGHHQTGGHIGQVHGLCQRQTGRQRSAQRGHHGVTCAGHIKHLLRTSGNMHSRLTAHHQAHAFFAASDQHRFQIERGAQLLSLGFNVSIAGAMPDHGFEFTHVRGDQGGAPVAFKVGAFGVDDDRLAGCACQLDHVSGATQSAFGIVRQNHGIYMRQLRLVGLQKRIRLPLGKMVFKIQTNQLLLARNNAQLGDGFAAFDGLQMRINDAFAE